MKVGKCSLSFQVRVFLLIEDQLTVLLEGNAGFPLALVAATQEKRSGGHFHKPVAMISRWRAMRSLHSANGGVAWLMASTIFQQRERLAMIFHDTNPNENRTGWTVGGGVEWAFAPNWSTFVGFNYYDFGTTSRSFTVCRAVCETPLSDIGQHVETLVLGLNYRFTGSVSR